MVLRNLAVRATVVLTFVVAAASPALAQPTEAQKNAMKANCRSDFMANCRSTSPGTKDALECLQTNLAKLSPGCHAAVKATMPKPAAIAPHPPPPVAPPPKAATVAPAAPPPAALAAPVAPAKAKAKAKVEPNVEVAAPKPAPAPPPPVAAAPPPEAAPAREPTAFAPGAALIAKACARDLLLHCRGKVGGGRAVACLNAYQDSGHRVGIRCHAALKMQSKLH